MCIKVAIVGGGGRVGASAAYALQCLGIVRQIVLIDLDAELAAGEALDLMHGSALAADQTIGAAGPEAAADADLVCISAGSRRKADESRLDLINRNVSIFRAILDDLRAHNLRKDALLLVVSNPVDILTRFAIEHLPWPAHQVMGLGTVLDTVRFCSIIASAGGLAPTEVKALILGEHGDTMTPIWSSATAGGLPLTRLLSLTEQNELFARTRGAGAEVIRRKGGAGYAVGLGIAAVIHSIALDQRRTLPVSTQMSGQYEIRGTCLSIPTVVGRAGVVAARPVELWPKEIAGIRTSATALDATWNNLRPTEAIR